MGCVPEAAAEVQFLSPALVLLGAWRSTASAGYRETPALRDRWVLENPSSHWPTPSFARCSGARPAGTSAPSPFARRRFGLTGMEALHLPAFSSMTRRAAP